MKKSELRKLIREEIQSSQSVTDEDIYEFLRGSRKSDTWDEVYAEIDISRIDDIKYLESIGWTSGDDLENMEFLNMLTSDRVIQALQKLNTEYVYNNSSTNDVYVTEPYGLINVETVIGGDEDNVEAETFFYNSEGFDYPRYLTKIIGWE